MNLFFLKFESFSILNRAHIDHLRTDNIQNSQDTIFNFYDFLFFALSYIPLLQQKLFNAQIWIYIWIFVNWSAANVSKLIQIAKKDEKSFFLLFVNKSEVGWRLTAA